jgi:ATP-binding cassette, subfamily B, bacterial
MSTDFRQDLPASGRRAGAYSPAAELPLIEGPGRPHATISGDRNATWLRRALPIVLAHKITFVTAIAGSFAALVVQVQIPTVMGHAFDRALIARSQPLAPFAWLLLGLALARWGLNVLSRVLLLRTAYRIEYDFRVTIYEHLTRLSFTFYDRVQSGEVMSRANSDIRAVQMYLAQAPIILAQCAVSAIVFVQMLVVNWRLAIAATVTLPFVGVVGVQMRKRLFPVSWLVQARLADVATVVDESTNGVRVVKSFAAEHNQVRALTYAARRAQWTVMQDARIRSRWSPVLENLPRLGQAVILLYGGWLAYQGQISIGTIVAFNAYLLLLQPPFRMLGMLMMLGQRARASAQRIYALLDEPPEIVDRPGAVDLVSKQGDVHFRDVWFTYAAGTEVLRGLDLDIAAGESVALVGRSGSGKSTIARLLARFYDVDRGSITIDGVDVRDYTLSSLRASVAMVLDEPFLFSASIRENVAYGRPDAGDDEIRAAARAAGAEEFIERLPGGYDEIVGERGYTLSGGQRQRIAIARALLLDPAVVVLDDATSAIDAELEQRIHRELRGATRDRTTIIIGHRLSTIELADRVVLIDEGRAVATGTHQQLLATVPRYAEVLAENEALAQHEDEVLFNPDELMNTKVVD